MFKLKPYRLREGQSVKPHSHRGYLTLGCVVTGSILEYRLSASRASPIVSTQHRAPALFLGKPNRIHTLIAETDSLLMGVKLPSSPSIINTFFMGLLCGCLFISSTAYACVTANQSLEAVRKEMQSHRQGLSHIDDADYLLLLEKKAHAGDIEAQITLGISLMEGYAGREDQVMGLYWLKHAAEDERGKGFYDAYMSDSAEGYVC